MSWLAIIILVILTILFGPRILIMVLVYCFAGWLLCDIDAGHYYTWYSGIWHGMFFPVNFIRSLIWEAAYKATEFSTGYNIFYWIFSVLSSIGFLFGGSRARKITNN